MRQAQQLTNRYISGLRDSYVSVFAHHSLISHTWFINTDWFYTAGTALPAHFVHNSNSGCAELTQLRGPLPCFTVFITSVLQPLWKVNIKISPFHALFVQVLPAQLPDLAGSDPAGWWHPKHWDFSLIITLVPALTLPTLLSDLAWATAWLSTIKLSFLFLLPPAGLTTSLCP